MKTLTEREANQYSPLSLAFLGDCIYEKYVREHIVLLANTNVSNLHNMSTKKVCAKFQSLVYEEIIGILTEREVDILKRGRNAKGISSPKNANIIDYRKATAVECLFGYLYLTGNEDRLLELMNIIWNIEIN
jgi:ribonuclease III family protein